MNITFYTLPGNEKFAPRVSHPGEDAGADIRAYAKDTYNRGDAIEFFRDFESCALKYGARLYIDGEVFTSESESDFLDLVDGLGGAVFLLPGDTIKVSAGFKIHMDKGDMNNLLPVYKIVPRSGLACNHGVIVTNSPGIIDSGYQDWIKVSLTNNGDNHHVFTHGSRIAQGLCELVYDQSLFPVVTDSSIFSPTSRGQGGFGSTNHG